MIVPDYIKDPQAIYDASFATVRDRVDFTSIPADMHDVVIRLVHACGMPDILDDLEFSADLVARAHAALLDGCPIFADCEMVASGITRRFLPKNNDIVVTLNDSRTAPMATKQSTTRSAAATDLWLDRIDNAILVFGNAPTALFRVLEHVAGGRRPAAILGFPVGFIGAAESKQTLAEFSPRVPFVTVHGTRGGSAMASAAINALALGAREGM